MTRNWNSQTSTRCLMEEFRQEHENVQRLSGLIPACSMCRLDVTIPADVNAISPLVDGLLQIARGMKCAEGYEYEIEVALREALANAIVHGCNNDSSKKVECCVACDGSSEIVIIVRDPGEGFKLESVPSPLCGENVYSTHGRGIYLINQLMDEVRFEAGGTEIRMSKKFCWGEGGSSPEGVNRRRRAGSRLRQERPTVAQAAGPLAL